MFINWYQIFFPYNFSYFPTVKSFSTCDLLPIGYPLSPQVFTLFFPSDNRFSVTKFAFSFILIWSGIQYVIQLIVMLECERFSWIELMKQSESLFPSCWHGKSLRMFSAFIMNNDVDYSNKTNLFMISKKAVDKACVAGCITLRLIPWTANFDHVATWIPKVFWIIHFLDSLQKKINSVDAYFMSRWC